MSRLSMRCTHHRQRGFTLIEMVISIAILSFLFILLYRSLTQILEAKRLLDDRRDLTAIAGAVIGRVSRELQLTTDNGRLLPPPKDPTRPYPSRVVFIGEHNDGGTNVSADSITFLAMEGGQYLPDGGKHSGLVQITYRAEKDPDRANEGLFYLVRDEYPLIRPPDKALKRVMTFPITNRLVSFEALFYSEDEQSWVNSWGTDNRVGLPQMIRLKMVLRSPLGEDQTLVTSIAIKRK